MIDVILLMVAAYILIDTICIRLVIFQQLKYLYFQLIYFPVAGFYINVVNSYIFKIIIICMMYVSNNI